MRVTRLKVCDLIFTSVEKGSNNGIKTDSAKKRCFEIEQELKRKVGINSESFNKEHLKDLE